VLLVLSVFGGFVGGVTGVSAAPSTTAECTAAGGTCYKTADFAKLSTSFYKEIGSCNNIAFPSDNHCVQKLPECLGADVECKPSCGAAPADSQNRACGGFQVCCQKVTAPTCTGTGKSCTLGTCGSNSSRDATLTCADRGAVCCVATPTTPGSTTTPPASTTPGSTTTPTPTTPGSNGTQATGTVTTSFANPLKYDTVQDVLGSLLNALQGIIVILSIVFIIIGALFYITSAGSTKQLDMAKAAIVAAMIGLAIGIAAPTFLKEISVILGWNAAPAEVTGAISLIAILTNVLAFLTGIVGVLAIIMLIIGALMYLTAAGDDDRISTGKKIVRFSIIGIIIAFAALVLVKQIAVLFIVS